MVVPFEFQMLRVENVLFHENFEVVCPKGQCMSFESW